jgi:hypothetical protein
MPTLRQKVDTFCKDSGAKVGESDKLRKQVADLKKQMQKVKETHKKQLKDAKAKTQKTKKVKAEPKKKKTQRAKKAKAPTPVSAPPPPPPAPAQAEPMMPAPSLAPAPQSTTGGKHKKHPALLARW